MMLTTLELVIEWVAAIVIIGALAYTILGSIGYLIYRRKHKDEDI